jgi:hypothetical protein
MLGQEPGALFRVETLVYVWTHRSDHLRPEWCGACEQRGSVPFALLGLGQEYT